MTEEPELITLPDTEVVTGNKYERIIRAGFFAHYEPGLTSFEFTRDDISGASVGETPKNIGDIIYTFRYRKPLPKDIQECAPEGHSWIIEGVGNGLYRFRAVIESEFTPDPDLKPIVLSDRTPEDVIEYGKANDEQAILAMMAYNRLLDIFLWCRLERKQGHWRTNVKGIGQIEIDDVYIGNNGCDGAKVVVTVQAKRDKDRISSVQILQDIRACEEYGDGRICRPVAVHYDSHTHRLALMEFALIDIGIVKIINEKHYLLQKPQIVKWPSFE